MSPALRQTVRERAGERCEYCRRCIPKLSVGCVTERGCVVLDQPQQLANLLRLVRRTQPRSDGNGTVNLGMHRDWHELAETDQASAGQSFRGTTTRSPEPHQRRVGARFNLWRVIPSFIVPVG